jgi:hypothetical protein
MTMRGSCSTARPIATPGVSCTPSMRSGSRPRPSTCWTSLGLTMWPAATISASTMAMVCSVSISSSSYWRRVRFCTTRTPSTARGAHDRHAGQRVIDLLAGLGTVGVLRMGLRVVEGERPGVRRDVADQALADPQARAVHGGRIEALGGEQLEHLAGAQQIDRADLGHHLVGEPDARPRPASPRACRHAPSCPGAA